MLVAGILLNYIITTFILIATATYLQVPTASQRRQTTIPRDKNNEFGFVLLSSYVFGQIMCIFLSVNRVLKLILNFVS